MLVIKQYIDLTKQLYKTKKDLKQATLKVTSVHGFLNDTDNSICSCVNLYRMPLLWGIYRMPADPVDYVEFCDDFCDDRVCWNKGCPKWEQNAKFIEARQAYNIACKNKKEFIKNLFKKKNK